MEVPPPCVFLSYTSELDRNPDPKHSYAQAARDAIQSSVCALRDMRDWAAEDRPPADVCVSKVRESDVFVAIIGVRYGDTVRDREDQCSYVELEFMAATHAGLPRYIFMLDPNVNLKIRWTEHNTDEEQRRLESFRQRLRTESGLTVKTITNRRDLRTQVARVLAEEAYRRTSVSPRDFDRNSTTQRTQAGELLTMVDIRRGHTVLDAGCGLGRLGMAVVRGFGVTEVVGIDRNPSMVKAARELAAESGMSDVLTFEQGDILEYSAPGRFDVVVTNNTMHWVPRTRAQTAYQRLHDALRPRTGVLAVHQGGQGTYQGLTACAWDVVRHLGLEEQFADWTYPLFYPSVDELRNLLKRVGFVRLTVKSVETDGREYPTLIEDYAHAGLAPFLEQLNPPRLQTRFRRAFQERARTPGLDRSAHNLYVVAHRK